MCGRIVMLALFPLAQNEICKNVVSIFITCNILSFFICQTVENMCFLYDALSRRHKNNLGLEVADIYIKYYLSRISVRNESNLLVDDRESIYNLSNRRLKLSEKDQVYIRYIIEIISDSMKP